MKKLLTRRSLVAGAAGAAICKPAIIRAACTTPTANLLPLMFGVKIGIAQGLPAEVESWVGRRVDTVGTTITLGAQFIGFQNTYPGTGGSLPFMNVSFPLVGNWDGGDNTGATFNDMGAAASGAYDARYQLMATAIKNFGNPTFSVRIGWEMSGNWYPWSVGGNTQNGQTTANQTYANYIAAFKRAATIIRSTISPVQIEWCAPYYTTKADPYWVGKYDAVTNPGGADVVSIDFYQANISQYYSPTNPATWATTYSGNNGAVFGIQYYETFARNNGVGFAWSEWAAGQASSKGFNSGHGLDDGVWTAAAIAYAKSLAPAGFFRWIMWSDDAPADDIYTAGANPNEQAAFKSAFQNTSFGGPGSGWWTGPAPP